MVCCRTENKTLAETILTWLKATCTVKLLKALPAWCRRRRPQRLRLAIFPTSSACGLKLTSQAAAISTERDKNISTVSMSLSVMVLCSSDRHASLHLTNVYRQKYWLHVGNVWMPSYVAIVHSKICIKQLSVGWPSFCWGCYVVQCGIFPMAAMIISPMHISISNLS